MSLCSDLTEKLDEEILEDLTSNVKQIQDNVLEEILTLNANTEYLRRFLHGSSSKELFKKNVPVVTYEDVKPFIDRVTNGEPSDIISGNPITGFLLSSGTSGGKQKMFPRNNKYLENIKFIFYYRSLVISKHIDGLEHGKGMVFNFCTSENTTPSGLPSSAASTSFFKSDYFKNRPSYWHWSYTSPDEVILCSDTKQTLYCHLLCGLVQRDDVVKVGAAFVTILVRAINLLENSWKEICTNIRFGHLSEWITDISCRDSVSKILGEPNPELADLIENECNNKSWEGIVPRLWPKAKFIECIATGQMAQHIPTLEFYSNKLPLISSSYVSSETMFGINMSPLCKPENVSYTFLPNLSYFEFLLVDAGDKTEIVDLVDVKLGCYYEPLVTNHSGLHRYKMGDILLVTGFYNNAPQFRFVRRGNLTLSIHLEITTDEDLLNAVTDAKMVLESSNLMLMDFTSYADISTTPGHYVLYWELKAKYRNDIVEIDKNVLVECCYVVEESLNNSYRVYRSKGGLIGALEIRLVQQGTFDALMEFFITQGASSTQYKTPICIKSTEALVILEENVHACFFTDKSLSFNFSS
ncbi:GH3 family [Arabidopsis suecica]|uniref:GH3 family n=1 Tax=Arabidopsis suecica TaxID=45249 RepID=A0A8T2DQ87_ARASU|nr:GH3 family [Arabidopsis suecica]